MRRPGVPVLAKLPGAALWVPQGGYLKVSDPPANNAPGALGAVVRACSLTVLFALHLRVLQVDEPRTWEVVGAVWRRIADICEKPANHFESSRLSACIFLCLPIPNCGCLVPDDFVHVGGDEQSGTCWGDQTAAKFEGWFNKVHGELNRTKSGIMNW